MPEAQAKAKPLHSSESDRPVMLVKVPHFVADAWLAALNAPGDSEDVELGRVVLAEARQHHTASEVLDPTMPHTAAPSSSAPVPEPTLEQCQEYTLQLSGGAGSNLPHTFRLREQPDASESLYAFSEGAEHVGITGQIRKRYDAEVAAGAGAMNGALDASYRALSRARHEAASKKTRTMQVIDDPLQALRVPGPRSIPQKPKNDRGHEHRARMDKQPLEAKMFRLFAKQDRWKFADLQKQTDQPAAWLKEVLQGIGVLNRKGPNMGLWELQREYRHAK